jgi:hypothetical protein
MNALIGKRNIIKKLAAQTNEVILKRNITDTALFQISDIKKITTAFHPFQVGSLGNFPYYWQHPANLKFNTETYRWISASIKANTYPIQLSQPFTNLYITTLSKVSYSLSKSDQSKLSQAQSNIINQQGALLKAWQAAFNTIPDRTETQEPIDIIIDKITQSWATPPITLAELQTEQNIHIKLNSVPMSGKSVIPILVNYLNALQSSVSLINAATMNRGYLQQALSGAQNPSTTNGGLQTSDGGIKPSYRVNTPLESILKSLNSTDTSNTVELSMSVVNTPQNNLSINLSDGTTETLPISEFLTIKDKNGTDFFREIFASDSSKATIDVTFKGVTTIYFGPAYFSSASNTNWYWEPPIVQALENGDKDISGFKFSPKPQIDFSNTGPFGFLTGVVISKRVSLKITAKCINYQSIAKQITALRSAHLKFLGIPMASTSSFPSGHQPSVKTDDEKMSLSINFEPYQDDLADTIDSTAIVLGVQTNHPISS